MSYSSCVCLRRVVNEDMGAAGVRPNERTHDAMAAADKDLSRMRTSMLQEWLREGGDVAMGAAWALLEKLAARVAADAFQFTVMLKACHGSKQQRELVEVTMRKAGVAPDVVTYGAAGAARCGAVRCRRCGAVRCGAVRCGAHQQLVGAWDQ